MEWAHLSHGSRAHGIDAFLLLFVKESFLGRWLLALHETRLAGCLAVQLLTLHGSVTLRMMLIHGPSSRLGQALTLTRCLAHARINPGLLAAVKYTFNNLSVISTLDTLICRFNDHRAVLFGKISAELFLRIRDLLLLLADKIVGFSFLLVLLTLRHLLLHMLLGLLLCDSIVEVLCTLVHIPIVHETGMCRRLSTFRRLGRTVRWDGIANWVR